MTIDRTKPADAASHPKLAMNFGVTTDAQMAAIVKKSRGKTRPPDEVLDGLLARIDSDRHTATGAEMYARAEARTPAERNQLAAAHPTFRTADGRSAYGARSTGGRR